MCTRGEGSLRALEERAVFNICTRGEGSLCMHYIIIEERVYYVHLRGGVTLHALEERVHYVQGSLCVH